MVNIGRRNLVLAILLLLVIVLAIWSQPDYEHPNVEFLPAMRRSPSFKAYEANPVLPGGTSMQPPIPGTIARGAIVLHYRATPEDALRAGEELKNPIPEQDKQHSASVARGRKVFQTYCSPCHGGGGAADGIVVQRGYPPPPSLLNGKSVQMKDGQLFHILSYGQGNMAPFTGQLLPEQRWDVINFVRSLQKAEAERVKAEAEKAAAEKKGSEQDRPDKSGAGKTSADSKPPTKEEADAGVKKADSETADPPENKKPNPEVKQDSETKRITSSEKKARP